MTQLFRSRSTAWQRRAEVCSFVTNRERTPLFCHGGNPELGIYLGDDRPVYWLFPHGMDGYPVPSTMEAMAQDYLPEIRRIRPHGPYFFLGCSTGGLVMLEIAQRFIEQGETVAMLAMIDTDLPGARAPASAPEAASDSKEMAAVKSLRRHLTCTAPQFFSQFAREFSSQRAFRWATRIFKRTACDGMISIGYRLPPFARRFYFYAKAEQVIAHYVPRQYNGALVVFRRPNTASDAQWRALAGGPLELRNTWLEPNELLQLPYVQILAEQIKNYMQEAEHHLYIPSTQAYLTPPAEVTSAILHLNDDSR